MLLVLVFLNISLWGSLFVTLVASLSTPAQPFLAYPSDVGCSDTAPYIIYVGDGGCTHWDGVFLSSTGQRGNQYCSLVGPVLVTNSNQYCFAS